MAKNYKEAIEKINRSKKYKKFTETDILFNKQDLELNSLKPSNIINQNRDLILPIFTSFSKKKIELLDFGGGGGNHFHAMRKFMPEKIFNWKIVETPELVERIVEKYNSSKFIFGKSKLNFHSNINDALSKNISIDFVIASSSLQYISDPYEKLNDLMRIGAKVLHISRMPFTNIGHLFSFNQITKLSENGPSKQRLTNYNPSVSNVVYIPNLEEFKKIIGNSYSKVTTLHESYNAYPNTNHRISQYSIIAVK